MGSMRLRLFSSSSGCKKKEMYESDHFRRKRLRQSSEQANGSNPDPAKLVPFGPFGAGQMTGHPIGLVIVIGVVLMGLLISPLFMLFFAASLLLGGGLGAILWLRHR